MMERYAHPKEAESPLPPPGPPMIVQCPMCGYDVAGLIAPLECPHCHCGSFEAFPRPGSALAAAVNQDENDDRVL